MEFSFFFNSKCSCKTLYAEILDSVIRIASDDYICEDSIISSNPVQVWFFNEDDNYNDDYVIEEYGFFNNHDLKFYVYQSKEESGIQMMFKIINDILTKCDVTNFVLQDSGGPWIMKSINGKKQMRDTDVFEYPFELVECSSEFERCEAERYG